MIADGNRHMQATGYGALSRAIILALKRYGQDIDLFVEKRSRAWDKDIPCLEELMQIPENSGIKGLDVVLRIGSPEGRNNYGVPTLVYTQNALGDLPPAWVDSLAGADGIVVPTEFDAKVFRKYFSNISICPQYVDANVFRPIPAYRKEGAEDMSFIFVGSYSFRKGVDLIAPIFSGAFGNKRSISLSIHCSTGLEKDGVTHLLREVRKLPGNINVNVFNGVLSPAWMNRVYNRHDVVFTFSRGEGWCMPLFEGLLCCKPLVCPDSTAMGESLPSSGVRRVKTNSKLICDLSDPFAYGMKKQYGYGDNRYWEVDRNDAAEALLEVADNYNFFTEAATAGRNEIRAKYSLENIYKQLKSAISLLGGSTQSSTEAKTAITTNSEITFSHIFKNNSWQSKESVSGTGSTLKATAELIPQLVGLFSELKIRSLIDCPCGDFNWIKSALYDLEKYYGYDVVPEVVELAKYKAKGLNIAEFGVANLVRDRLPEADIILVRDCFVHLSFAEIIEAVKNLKLTKIKWLLTTTFPDVEKNIDVKTGQWRPLNMEVSPLGWQQPDKLLIERPSIPPNKRWGRKALGLWMLHDN